MSVLSSLETSSSPASPCHNSAFRLREWAAILNIGNPIQHVNKYNMKENKEITYLWNNFLLKSFPEIVHIAK